MKNEPLSTNDDLERQLDLLADGELDAAERRELLTRLEHEPDGWRRCALALIEAQTWRSELHGWADSPDDRARRAPEPDAATARAGGARRPASPRTPIWALAASVLCAFGLGLAARNGLNFGDGSAPRTGVGDSSLASAPESADAPTVGEAESIQEPASDDEPRYGAVQVVVNDGPGGQTRLLDVPVIETAALDENWLAGEPAALPKPVEEALRYLGHDVRQYREYVPVMLEDGRQAIFPIDQVEITPAVARTYQ